MPRPAQPIGKLLQERRKTLGITQEQLARAADIPYTTLTKVESGAIKNPSMQLVWKLSRVLDISINSLLEPKVFEGENTLREIWMDIFAALTKPGEYMYITGIDESQYLQWDNGAIVDLIEQARIRGLGQKLICCEGDTQFLAGDHLEYRAIPREHFSPTPMYVYADRIAFLIWGPPTQAIIVQNKFLADAYLKQFLFIWDHAIPIKRKPLRDNRAKSKKSLPRKT